MRCICATLLRISSQLPTHITSISRNEWKSVAEVVTDLDPTLPLVACFTDDINQVILNILINAAHAIAEVVGNSDHQKGRITIQTRLDDDWAEIRIRDTGTGIPEAIRSHLTDTRPFR